jgi:PIN domain nuclease of toxin-antitoxin system
VKLLLDTHAVLWWRLNDRRLKREARDAVAAAEIVWVSAASGWEAAIKQALGKLRLEHAFDWMVSDSEFDELPLTIAHTNWLVDLPQHHADPFDRMLIAQALAERATIVTHDRQFEPYDVPVIWT